MNGYRITDREHQSYPINKSLVNTYVFPKQIIIRAGYYISPMDMPENECEEKCYDWLTSKGVSKNDVQKYANLFGISVKRLLKTNSYTIRGRWKAAQEKDNPYKHIKTFWYEDVVESIFPWYITGTVVRRTGLYHPGRIYGDNEYYPAYLEIWTTQILYTTQESGVYIHPLDLKGYE